MSGNEEARTAAAQRPSAPPHSNNQMFRNYYKDNDIFCSPEGILKLISIVSSAAVAALWAAAGGVAAGGAAAGGVAAGGAAAGGAAAGGAAAAVAVAAAEAGVVLGRVLRAPLLAPQTWLYAEVAVSAAGGALLLVRGALAALGPAAGAARVAGSLAVVTAGMVAASAALTYRGATRPAPGRAGPGRESRPPATREHDV